MAIHCDVCGTLLMAAYENEGPFGVGSGFRSLAPSGGDKIRNSCEPCGQRLRKATQEAARIEAERIQRELSYNRSR